MIFKNKKEKTIELKRLYQRRAELMQFESLRVAEAISQVNYFITLFEQDLKL